MTQYAQKAKTCIPHEGEKTAFKCFKRLHSFSVLNPHFVVTCDLHNQFLLFFFPLFILQKQSKTNQRNKQTTYFLVKQNKGGMFHLGKGGYRYQGQGTAGACLRQWQSFLHSDRFGTFHRSAANWWQFCILMPIKCRKKMKAVNSPYLGSVHSKRKISRGASVMWQHRQGSKEQPSLLSSLGAESEPPSRPAPQITDLIFKYFVFFLC